MKQSCNKHRKKKEREGTKRAAKRDEIAKGRRVNTLTRSAVVCCSNT